MIDILKIASTCKLYNFHTHTQFCDGHACMEDFVTAAIATHFSHLGFTHSISHKLQHGQVQCTGLFR